jgi:hypothetical protein
MWLVPSVRNPMRCCFLKEETNVLGFRSIKPNEIMFFLRMVIDMNGWNSLKC